VERDIENSAYSVSNQRTCSLKNNAGAHAAATIGLI